MWAIPAMIAHERVAVSPSAGNGACAGVIIPREVGHGRGLRREEGEHHGGTESEDAERTQRDGASFPVRDDVVLGLGNDRAVVSGLHVYFLVDGHDDEDD